MIVWLAAAGFALMPAAALAQRAAPAATVAASAQEAAPAAAVAAPAARAVAPVQEVELEVAAAVQKAVTPAREHDFEALAEDVEVMRRILVESLRDHYEAMATVDAPEAAALQQRKTALEQDLSVAAREGYLLTHPGISGPNSVLARYRAVAGQVAHADEFRAQGFCIPGSGVFFTLDVAVPLKMVKEPAPNDENASTDAWEAAKRAVQQGAPLAPRTAGAKPERWVMDPDATAGVIDAILDAIAEHGWRIEQLRPSEVITVAVRFTAPGGGGHGGFSRGRASREYDRALDLLIRSQSDASAARGVTPRHVMIQASKKNLDAIHAGRLDRKTFKKQVRTVEYTSMAAAGPAREVLPTVLPTTGGPGVLPPTAGEAPVVIEKRNEPSRTTKSRSRR